MKLLKNSLLIVALLGIGSIAARAAKKATTTSTTKSAVQQPVTQVIPQGPAPALPGQSFQTLLVRVRMMPSSEVINEQGVFTDTFLNTVKNANLTPELTRAVLEAARNLHLPLSGNDDQDKELMMYAGERIDGVIASLGILVPYKTQPLTPQTGAIVPYQPAIYDSATKLVKQDYLENKARELLRTKTGNQVTMSLTSELTSQLADQWKINGVQATPTLLSQARDQIRNTVTRLEKEQKEQGQMVVYQPGGAIIPYSPATTVMADFYDPASKLIKPDYLENRARELLQTKTADQVIAILSPELTTGLGAQWRISKVKVTPALLNQAHTQVQETVNRLEEEKQKEKWENPKAEANPTPWYDGWTHEMNQAYLEDRIRKAKNINTVKQELTFKMIGEWGKRKVTDVNGRKEQFKKQFDQTAAKIEQEKKSKYINIPANKLGIITTKEQTVKSSPDLLLPMTPEMIYSNMLNYAKQFVNNNQNNFSTELFTPGKQYEANMIKVFAQDLQSKFPSLTLPEINSLIYEAITQHPAFKNYDTKGLNFFIMSSIG